MKRNVFLIGIVLLVIILVCISYFLIMKKRGINYDVPGIGGAFITEGQSRDITEYDSFSEWKQDLKKDMDEHNKKAEREKEDYLKNAEQNAKKYIKNKYGFEPVFTDKNAEYSISMVGGYDDAFVGWNYNYSGMVLLKFEKDNKEYYVLISGKGNDNFGCDNYQYETIVKSICNELNNNLNVPILDYDIKLGKSYKLSDTETIYNLKNEYFNGNNYKEMLSDSKIFLEYGEQIDLEDNKWHEIKEKYLTETSELYVIKYKTDEEYKIAKSNYDNNSSFYSHDIHMFVYDKEFYGYDLLEKALNIDCCLTVVKDKLSISKPQIGECDGVYVVQWDVANAPTITKSETADIETARR